MILAHIELEFLLDTVRDSNARRKRQPRRPDNQRVALRRYMYTTNSTYSDIVVGVGTLSSTPSALDDGA